MNPVLLVLMMIGIGALIGGLTNSLAIKMLFRPYRALYIKNFRLPFTPGLIPKRQKELARQLGRMVVEHLLTAEGLRRKLERPAFQTQMTEWAQEEIEKILNHPATLKEMLEELDLDMNTIHLEQSISSWVENRYHSVMDNYRDETLENLLSHEWKEKIEVGADQLADHIQEQVTLYFQSPEGRYKVTALIDNYLDNQGFLGNMISSFMGPDGITERIYPAIIRYVSDKEMTYWLRGMLQSELQRAMNQPVGFYEDKIGRDAVGHTLGQAVAKALPLEEWLQKTVAEWSRPYQNKILQEFVPLLVKKASVLLSGKIESMMESMHLSEIVKEEVEAFQVDRLEEMVLGISRREFKMITYLGALLGGLIGLLQGLIVLFLG